MLNCKCTVKSFWFACISDISSYITPYAHVPYQLTERTLTSYCLPSYGTPLYQSTVIQYLHMCKPGGMGGIVTGELSVSTMIPWDVFWVRQLIPTGAVHTDLQQRQEQSSDKTLHHKRLLLTWRTRDDYCLYYENVMLSALLTLCTTEVPSQRPILHPYDDIFVISLTNLFNKQWWFETPWGWCGVTVMFEKRTVRVIVRLECISHKSPRRLHITSHFCTHYSVSIMATVYLSTSNALSSSFVDRQARLGLLTVNKQRRGFTDINTSQNMNECRWEEKLC